ncbi:phosphoesterase PA-phosphatase related protein [Methanohalophilus mahii DSM 5219]|uniref:Phosphoesterase PA-phosphatase related protein n=2 Tax=Methanohalophilus mahii TaxID=2176 RepID=D5E9D5_METMS|nr:phosphoesterase PA-phosphatase related protein [Methanohalophilus mahii DSM 5219]
MYSFIQLLLSEIISSFSGQWLSQYMMTIVMIPLLFLMVTAGYVLFVPVENRRPEFSSMKGFFHFVVDVVIYAIPMLIVYALVHMQTTAATLLGVPANQNYAHYIMILEGDVVSLIQEIATPLLTYASGFFYLLMFPFLLTFTFLLLVYLQRHKAVQEFVVAFILIYLLAFPFYILFPVHVTGYTLSGVSPLLYNLSPFIAEGVRIVDPDLNNCFPSLHTALSVMAMIMVLHNVKSRRYQAFAVITTAAILFTILYLGIHWLSDLVGGTLLAIVCCLIAFRYSEHLFSIYRWIVAMLSWKLKGPALPCVGCNRRINFDSVMQCDYCGTEYNIKGRVFSLLKRFRKRFSP